MICSLVNKAFVAARAPPPETKPVDPKDKKKKKDGASFFDKFNLFGNKKEVSEEDRRNIKVSGPTGYSHVSHIGWTAGQGFELRNIPPEWRGIFQKAGVKDEELQNP